MHNPIQVNNDTWWIGVNDFETDLFESLWPLPQGVAYNSYLITGTSATAAIDTVKELVTISNVSIDALKELIVV